VIKLEGAPESYSVATNLSNVASVTTTSFDPDLTNNVDVVSVPMTHQADLKITKDPSAQDITPGAEVSWRLTVTNKCDPSNPSACLSDATEVVITDTVADPARLVLTGATGGDGSGGIEGNVQVTCTSPVQPAAVRCSVVTSDGHGRLKPGQTATVEVTGYVPANVLSGTVVNNAAVTSATFDPNQLDNIATADLTPKNPISDIQVVKSGPATAIPGNRVDYSITATNWGPSDAVNVQFTDQLPAILTADSSTKVTTNRGTCAISGSKITCDIPDFPGPNTPGGTPANVTINITGALLAPSATASFTNTVAVTCGGTACVEGPNPKPDTPSVTTTPSPQADLAVSKTANVSQIPGAGDEVLYTVTVVNNGPSNASGVTLGDVLPGGMTVVGIAADNGGSCEATGPSCNLGNLAPGVGVEVAIRAKVDAGGLTPSGLTAYTQTATVTSNTPDPSGPNNTAEWEHKGGASPADLAILKISHGIEAGVTGDPSATGANVYELRVTNLGPATAHNVVVKDTLPTGLTFVASNPAGCTATGQEVTCLGTVLSSPGTASWNLAVKADQALAAGSLVTNTATVTADEPDPSLANNTSVAHDSVSAAADLVIDYEIGYGVYYDPGSPGVPILITDPTDARLPTHYTGPGSVRYVMVHVVNNGPAVARNVRGMSNVAVSAIPDANSLPPDCTTVNQQVVCDLGGSLGGNLETGEGFKFVFPFTISPSTPQNTSYPDCGRDNPCAAGTPGGWANAATSTPDPNLVNNYDTAGLVIGATETDLHVTKTALSTFVNADSHDAYTAGTKFGYRIDLWIPAGWDSVEEVSLPWGDAANVQLVDTLPTGFSATQVNTAQGTCDPIDPDSQTPVTSIRCDLGNVAASTNGKLGPDGKPLVAPRVVSVYVYGSIAPNVTAEISDGTGAKNVATANSATLDHLTGLATSKTALVEVDVVQQSDLAVTKLADAATSYAGANVGYTVTTVNNGPSDATNTKIVDTLAPGLTLDEAASPNCQVTGGSFAAGFEITCYPQFPGSPLGALPANQSVNTRIVTTSDPRDLRPYWCYGQNPDVTPVQTCPEVLPPTSLYLEHPRDLPNKVVVSSAALDSDPSNNKAEILTQMRTLADIAVAGSASSTSPAAGSTIKYTLTAVNLGPSALDNPKVVATFPPGFVPTAVEIGAMNCSISGPAGTPPGVYTVSCSNKPETPVRDSFQPGITAAGVVSVFIPADTPAGDYTAEAVTYSRSTEQCADPDNPPQNNNVGTCESNYANNTASVTVTVVDSADTALTKTLTSAVPLVAGSSVTYQLTVTNNGPSAAHDVTVADKVPAGMTFVSGQVQAGPACAVTDDPEEGNVVWCEVGTMAPHAQVTIDLTFQVGLHPAAQLCNTALVGSGALDPDPSNNQSGEICANTAPPPPTDVGVEVTAGTSPVLNGEPVSYTVVVTNHGPHPTTGAEVAITVPAHIVNPQVVVSTQTGQVQPGACTVSGSVFTCAIGDFWSGDTVTYAVTGTAGVVQDETLTVRAASSHDGTDADPTNDRDDASIDVDDHADLVLTKTLVSPAAPPLTAGGNVVYKLTATNAGPSAAEDVTIVDNVPDGLAFVSGPANCVATVQANGASVITCSLGKLAPSASTPVELTFKVAEAYRGQLCNAASVTSTTPDLTPGNNDATLCSNVVGPPTDVSVKVTADKPKIVTGDPVGYTVVVKNNGPSPTTGTKVIITVPPNVANPKVTVAGHTGSVVPGACTAVGSVVTCVIGDLAVGDTVTYRVAGTAQVTTARDLTLRAHVAHDDSDTDPSNDDSSAVIAVGVDSGLPVTGAGIVAPLALAALLVTLGVVLRSRRRRDLSLQ
jgi:uncharacterized repeat protein (TIGR01451 family)